MIARRRAAAWVLACFVLSAGCKAKSGTESNALAGDGGWKGLSFVEDDYNGALVRARSEHRLLFVDAWAPWCHTCLSMKSFVFGDRALAPLEPSFVWASIDTEKEQSASFVRKFAIKNWPTLWVIDPATEKPVLKWAGSVTAPELVMLLESATNELSGATPGTAQAAAAWMRGNHEAAAGRRDEAIAEYRSALERAPSAWTGRPRVVDALAYQLQGAKQSSECVALSLREWPALPPGTSRLNVAVDALGCAGDLAKDAPERAGVAALAKDAARLATDPKEPVLADDRSSLFETLVDFHRANGDEPQARALAQKWRDFLESEASRAPNARTRAVFDSHRIGAYEAVGELDKAIPMLEKSERDFPDDYNPPARLAKVYLDLGRFDAALAAVRRAEAKVYGPRALRVFATEADIWLAMKKSQEAKQALQRASELGDKLELPGSYRDLLERIKARAAAL